VALHLVEPGDIVQVGTPLAELRDIWGRPLAEPVLYSEYEGVVMGRSHGIYYHPGEALLGLAIRDDAPLIAPYPADYFKDEVQ
jgi:hypothetical protein